MPQRALKACAYWHLLVTKQKLLTIVEPEKVAEVVPIQGYLISIERFGFAPCAAPERWADANDPAAL